MQVWRRRKFFGYPFHSVFEHFIRAKQCRKWVAPRDQSSRGRAFFSTNSSTQIRLVASNGLPTPRYCPCDHVDILILWMRLTQCQISYMLMLTFSRSVLSWVRLCFLSMCFSEWSNWRNTGHSWDNVAFVFRGSRARHKGALLRLTSLRSFFVERRNVKNDRTTNTDCIIQQMVSAPVARLTAWTRGLNNQFILHLQLTVRMYERENTCHSSRILAVNVTAPPPPFQKKKLNRYGGKIAKDIWAHATKSHVWHFSKR